MIAWPAASGENFKHIYTGARHKMQAGDYPAASIELNNALDAAQLSSEEVAVLFDLAYVCLKTSKLDESIKYLEQILDMPDLAENERNKVYLQLADVHVAAKKYDEAIGDCNDGLSKATEPSDKFRLLLKIANIMNTKKDYAAAMNFAQQALALCKDNIQNQLAAKRLMIWIYSAQKNYPGVVEVYTRQELDAMPADFKKSIYPNIINAYMIIAGNMQAEKNYAQALELYDMIKKDKNVKPEQRSEAYMGEASILKTQQKYSEAIKSYHAVLSIQETRPAHKKIAQKEIDQLQNLPTKQ